MHDVCIIVFVCMLMCVYVCPRAYALSDLSSSTCSTCIHTYMRANTCMQSFINTNIPSLQEREVSFKVNLNNPLAPKFTRVKQNVKMCRADDKTL